MSVPVDQIITTNKANKGHDLVKKDIVVEQFIVVDVKPAKGKVVVWLWCLLCDTY